MPLKHSTLYLEAKLLISDFWSKLLRLLQTALTMGIFDKRPRLVIQHKYFKFLQKNRAPRKPLFLFYRDTIALR